MLFFRILYFMFFYSSSLRLSSIYTFLFEYLRALARVLYIYTYTRYTEHKVYMIWDTVGGPFQCSHAFVILGYFVIRNRLGKRAIYIHTYSGFRFGTNGPGLFFTTHTKFNPLSYNFFFPHIIIINFIMIFFFLSPSFHLCKFYLNCFMLTLLRTIYRVIIFLFLFLIRNIIFLEREREGLLMDWSVMCQADGEHQLTGAFPINADSLAVRRVRLAQ